jgi:hypothetical protein
MIGFAATGVFPTLLLLRKLPCAPGAEARQILRV